MKISYPNYYFDFHCIGGSCEATCCKGWKIEIDGPSLRKYKKMKGPFAYRLKEGISYKESCFHMVDEKCAMLNADGWCDLQIALGEKALCKTCDSFPRHREDFGILQEKMLSLSCPEAARLILFSQKPVKYILKEKKESIESSRYREKGIDDALRKCLLDIRKTIETIYTNKKIPLHIRKIMVAYLVHDVQQRLDKNCLELVKEVLMRYEKNTAIPWFMERFSSKPSDGEVQKNRKELLTIYRKMEIVWSEWEQIEKKILYLQNQWEKQPVAWSERQERYGIDFEGIEQARENLFVYFLHTWFLGALFDGNIVSKMNLIFASCEMIEEIALANWVGTDENIKNTKDIWTQAAWSYARQIEHADENLELLEEILPY